MGFLMVAPSNPLVVLRRHLRQEGLEAWLVSSRRLLKALGLIVTRAPAEVGYASRLRKSTGEGFASDHSSESNGSHHAVPQLEADHLWNA